MQLLRGYYILLTHIVPVWMAARATSAAPALFTPIQDKYIDGGLKANNPCQEAMRVINEYDQSRGIPERHFLLAVSVGTGIDPDKAVFGGIMDKGMPLVKHAKYLKQLLGIFVDAVSNYYYHVLSSSLTSL